MYEQNQLRCFMRVILSIFSKQVDMQFLCSDDAVELLMLTAAQETFLGKYLRQLNDGPAMGMFQIEGKTYHDFMLNYIHFRPELMAVLINWQSPGVPDEYDLMGNLPFQIVVARLIYYRAPEKLPGSLDVYGMAQYWKRYWNTSAGKGTVEQAVTNYQKYVKGEERGESI